MGCPVPALSSHGSLQLHLIGLSGQKAHVGQAVSASRCAAVHRCVLHNRWERSRTCSYFRQHEPRVVAGTHGAPLPWRAPPWHSPHREPCSPRPGCLGGPCGHHVHPHSPTIVFYQNRDLHSQTKSSSFTLCYRSFCPLKSSIGKPEIRKFLIYLNYTGRT